MSRDRHCRRRDRGVYFVPARNFLGEAPLPEEKLVAEKLTVKRLRDRETFGNERLNVNRLIPTGLTLYNLLGLTTQLAARKEFVSTIAFEGKLIRVRRMRLEVLQAFDEKEVLAFFGLSELRDVGHEDADEVVNRFRQYLRAQKISFGKLRDMAIAYGGGMGRKAMLNLELAAKAPNEREG